MSIDWKPGLGDPTFMGGLTVAAYFGAALMCTLAARSTHKTVGRPGSARAFWLSTACIFVLLGLNKQLDLQSLLTSIARSLAKAQGWYDERRFYQVAFVAVVGTFGFSAAMCSLWCLRRSSGFVRLALLGLFFTLTFIVMRAASFHHVDMWLAASFLGMKWVWLIEFAGIIVVAIAAALARPQAS